MSFSRGLSKVSSRSADRWPDRARRGLAGIVLALPLAAHAGPPPTAAGIDWRERSELPPAQAAALPEYCSGAYLPPDGPSTTVPGLPGQSPDSDREAPIEASGQAARYEMDTSLTLTGDVHVRQGAFSAQGSQLRYDQTSGRMALDGPMRSRGEGVLLTGESATYQSDTGNMRINTASFLVHANEMRGQAASLSRPSENRLLIEEGRFTTCAPDSNAWQVRASQIDLDRAEGFGTARHVRLEVKDVPVFYWPWISFPIDDRRKTGFLYPSFGTSNAGGGAYVSVPYYLNLAPHYDATLTPQYIHGRGLFTEVEGRYLSDFGQSDLQLGYIADDDEFVSENPGVDNGERWGLDFRSRASFGSGWRGYADYSAVSDNDYIGDLNRSLDINTATHLRRRGGVRYDGDQQYFEAYANGYQTVRDNFPLANKPYDQLPEILYGADLDWGVPELLVESQYTYFHRDNTGLTGLDRANGHRWRVAPELALNAREVWGYARPSVTLDHTLYQLEDLPGQTERIDRTVPIYEWDSGLYFDRQSSLFGTRYNQSLEPRLYYAYSEAEDQSDIPDFDTALKSFSFDQLFSPHRFSGGDRVSDNNRLTAAVTTRFNDLETGAERARLSVGQVYYYDDREVGLKGGGTGTGAESPLAGEALLRPLDNLDIRASGLWDPQTGETVQGRSQLVYHSPGYRYLATLGHTYDKDGLEQSDIGAVVPVTDQVSLIGRWVYDAENDQTVGSLAGVEYTDCCWSAQVVAQSYQTTDRQLDHRILFQIRLKGLGGSGGAGDRIGDAIYGYEQREERRYGR
ncbi:LPS biosynthesis protein [Tamilnaduibacter salinus]|uniref:LPS-assembly protein LptD n=1 Tax=Tamilnaduibacter salinus TaxID=1484056 RepID=A0A2A2I3Q9_9GAMM|nr:LPS biosynthesis protein [Tamilnaduibacter salinus]